MITEASVMMKDRTRKCKMKTDLGKNLEDQYLPICSGGKAHKKTLQKIKPPPNPKQTDSQNYRVSYASEKGSFEEVIAKTLRC